MPTGIYIRTEINKKNIALSRVGKFASKETKIKMSKSRIGNKNVLGKHWKRTPISRARQVEYYKKNGHPSTGLRYGKKFNSLKRVVLARDGYMCKMCFISDREVLIVDHIKSKSVFPEFANDINNLITLCANCHLKKTKSDIKRGQLIVGRKNKMSLIKLE